MALAGDDFFDLLSSVDETLSEDPIIITADSGPPVPALTVDEEWQNDTVPVKLDKIRAVFLNGKTAGEVKIAAGLMPVGDWIETVAKMTKQVDAGPVQITAIRIELPPREVYSGNVIDIEVPQQ